MLNSKKGCIDENGYIDEKDERILSAFIDSVSSGDSDLVQIGQDENLKDNDISNLKDHNEQYTDLLKGYVEYSKSLLRKKNRGKVYFFFLCLALMSAPLVLMIIYIYTASSMNDGEALFKGLSVITSYIVSVSFLPKIITQYLFNSKEESDVVALIKNMQEYDGKVRDMINK